LLSLKKEARASFKRTIEIMSERETTNSDSGITWITEEFYASSLNPMLKCIAPITITAFVRKRPEIALYVRLRFDEDK
jgi:hypothetical protein